VRLREGRRRWTSLERCALGNPFVGTEVLTPTAQRQLRQTPTTMQTSRLMSAYDFNKEGKRTSS